MAKSRGRHKLCAVEVEAAKPRAKRWALEDGDGLRLYVEPNGSKRWAIRVTVQGKRKERGLGVYPTVKLAHARQEAERFRNAAALGRDARRDDKLASAATDVSFRSAFEAMFEIHHPETTIAAPNESRLTSNPDDPRASAHSSRKLSQSIRRRTLFDVFVQLGVARAVIGPLRRTTEDWKELPVEGYVSKITVREVDGRSIVEWRGAFSRAYLKNDPPPELSDDAAIAAVVQFQNASLAGLKRRLESKM